MTFLKPTASLLLLTGGGSLAAGTGLHAAQGKAPLRIEAWPFFLALSPHCSCRSSAFGGGDFGAPLGGGPQAGGHSYGIEGQRRGLPWG
jgi:hypothetical protein